MKKVQITLSGCDDSTTINIAATESQFKFLTELSRLSYDLSTSGCMPTLGLKEVKTNEI